MRLLSSESIQSPAYLDDVLTAVSVVSENPVFVSELPVLTGAFSPTLASKVNEVNLVWSCLGPDQEPVITVIPFNLKGFQRRR